MIWMDVDTALSGVPVNYMPLTDDTDMKTRETAVAYNAAGMDLVWNFTTTGGVTTQTAVTPTTSGVYDWTHKGDGMYTIEIPASGGASINNDAEGFGWFTGVATGVLPWAGPIIGFRAAAINNALIDGGDTLDVNVTEWKGSTAPAMTGDGYAVAVALRDILIVDSGTVADLAPTSAGFSVTGLDVASDQFYNDARIQFTTGALTGQSRPLASMTGAGAGAAEFTFSELFTTNPSNGDAFVILSDHVHPVDQIASVTADAILDNSSNKLVTNASGQVGLDLAQVTANGVAVGDALDAAWAQGFGKWTRVGTVWTLYGPDGTTPLVVFNLNSATAPTSRTPV